MTKIYIKLKNELTYKLFLYYLPIAMILYYIKHNDLTVYCMDNVNTDVKDYQFSIDHLKDACLFFGIIFVIVIVLDLTLEYFEGDQITPDIIHKKEKNDGN